MTTARFHLLPAAALAAALTIGAGAVSAADARIVIQDDAKTASLPLGAVPPDNRWVGVAFPVFASPWLAGGAYYPYAAGVGTGYGPGFGYDGPYGGFNHSGIVDPNPDRAYRRQIRRQGIRQLRVRRLLDR